MLRYRDTVPEASHLVRRQMARQIEPVKPEHRRLKRPPPEIEDKARTMLQPLNNHTYTPEAMQTIEQFVDGVYFPTWRPRNGLPRSTAIRRDGLRS